MNIISHKNKWNMGTVQVHVDPTPIPLIKINNKEKSDKYFVNIQFCRDPTSEKLDLYEFKMTLFLLFICNFNMTLEASGTLKTGANIQYLCTLVCG